MRALLFAAGVASLASAGCLRSTTYKCATNDQCGAEGVCETTGFCSFVDGECADGRRYGASSSDLSNTCVGGGGSAEVDSGMTTPDTPMAGGCPASYTTLGSLPNRYRVITAAAGHAAQVTACSADGANAYLAIPDDMAELQALVGAANANFWVGVSDPAENMMYVTVNGAAFNSTLWDAGEPDNDPETGGGNNNSFCVAAFSSSSALATDRCMSTYAAVCECEP